MSDDARLLLLLERLRRLGMSTHPLRIAGLSPPQLVFLAQIAQSPGCRLKDVGDALGVTPPTASVAVRHLEKKGLVERRPDPTDGRAVQLFLSRKGASLHRRAETFRRDKARHLLAALRPEERSVFLDLLQQALGSAEQEQGPFGEEDRQ